MCHLVSLWERRHHYEHALSGKGSRETGRLACYSLPSCNPQISGELPRAAIPASPPQVFRGSPPVPLCSLLVCKSNKEMLNPETQGDMSKVVIFQYCDGSPVPVC